ncbi:conserved hypothetical protein [Leishmania major strain Friedlin]|uniref:Uncharacterized protein n=1 Tax=Leishmania major TaxID=5664 RepID=E9ADL0_LEIMA|nr:conserved hypothetical protein [Leishmania major strain Friedlin]CAG9577736.1 hypothetical_protein_-_conserved [Leishmania major strain Friedlin]CBZ12339.1 conserved hypothetical protein [Leishmania major strain Friedlin]|eukprot:XP_003722082.1 conserved hypothetical protein [Leishmania major strain Friedlin]
MNHSPFLTALYTDVQSRLPLWTTRYVKPISNGTFAVSSTWTDDSGAQLQRLFIAVEASDTNCISEAVLAEWIAFVEAWQAAHKEDEVSCFVGFVDLAGTVSYYRCETAVAGAWRSKPDDHLTCR